MFEAKMTKKEREAYIGIMKLFAKKAKRIAKALESHNDEDVPGELVILALSEPVIHKLLNIIGNACKNDLLQRMDALEFDAIAKAINEK